ncbi:SHOCT domain-containing protein [Kitasatospora kazusensis]|uniref:SHOCT domain-containing protein n=1 Tax=Kitasatospora kazusensis TaxID=407974 RepID=A0ABN3A481_9ACTN
MNYPLLDIFWTMLWFFMWIIWIMLLFRIIADIIRSHDMGGWGKAGWMILIILLPFVGVIVYLIVRGGSMARREVKQAQEREDDFRSYIKDAAGPGDQADQIAKLAQLKEQGHLSEEEYQRAKAKILA